MADEPKTDLELRRLVSLQDREIARLTTGDDDLREMILDRLGQDYDPAKIEKICELRTDPKQAEIAKQYEQGVITADQYVDRMNEAIHQGFQRIENAIGQDDFVTLFEFTAEEVGKRLVIDKDKFAESEKIHAQRQPPHLWLVGYIDGDIGGTENHHIGICGTEQQAVQVVEDLKSEMARLNGIFTQAREQMQGYFEGRPRPDFPTYHADPPKPKKKAPQSVKDEWNKIQDENKALAKKGHEELVAWGTALVEEQTRIVRELGMTPKEIETYKSFIAPAYFGEIDRSYYYERVPVI